MDEDIPYGELLVDVEDSIVVGLYHYLWLKDGKGRPCPEVNVPHTIIVSNGRPKVWYFTSGKEHCIKRKHRSNINNATIMEALAPKPKGGDSAPSSPEPSSSGGLIGSWGAPSSPSPLQRQQQSQQQGQQKGRKGVFGPSDARGGSPASPDGSKGGAAAAAARVADGNSTGNALGPWPHHGVVARFQGSMTNPQLAANSANANKGASLGRRKKGAQFELQEESVEFFSREQLAEMLPPGHSVVHGVAALHEGVLQRFVQPRGQHHFSIRATWSPNACVVERRTSKAKLNDPRVPLADRLAGWDGPNWLSEHTLITGTVLHGSVCRVCDNVAAHLADVSSGGVRVLRMVLFFMVDDANRIWLTHCGTLKTQRLPEMAYAVPLAPMGSGAVAMQMAARLRPGSMPLPLPAGASPHLRLRGLDGGASSKNVGGGGGGTESGLDLPAPSPVFVSSKVAAANAGDGEDGDGPGGSGRFLCVLTGEMYPGSQRCDVTYKQLLQHWFGLASQLPNEGDRLRAMDTIPLAIRRANPSLTREWYLRVRSQPTFLYRTAPICAEAAGQITGVALEELQRTMRPTPSGSGPTNTGMAGPAAVFGAGSAGPGISMSGAARPSQGSDMIPGGFMGGLGRHGGGGTRPTTAAAALVRHRPNTAATALVRHRPNTAATGATGQLPPPPGTPGQSSHPPRLSSRQQTGGVSRGALTRSKSASPSLAAARLAPVSHSGAGGMGMGMGIGVGGELSGLSAGGSPGPSRSGALQSHHQLSSGGGILPSMLLPRDRVSPQAASSLLQVYGPTAEQAADAAMAAAAFPYEVLNEAQQDGGGGADGGEEGDTAADATVGAAGSPRAYGSGPGAPSRSGSLGPGASTGASASGQQQPPGQTNAGPSPSPGVNAWGQMGGGGPVHGTAVPSAGRPGSRRGHMRMSASSEVTELGSNGSNSDPSSPNGTHMGLHPQPAGHNPGQQVILGLGGGLVVGVPNAGGSGGGGSGAPTPARMSPPRSAAVLTLHTIHEEGALVHPPSNHRPPSPLGPGGELAFPPPRSAGGSHSVPRMRPQTRGGTDRPAPPGTGYGNRGGRYGTGAPYSLIPGMNNRGLSESGDLPMLPHGGSLDSTAASSMAGSIRSRRSTNTNVQQNPGVLSTDDLRTLRELNEAYTAAERLTQQLLAQAQEILSEDGGSRPASTGNSPARRQVSPRGPSGLQAGSGGGGGGGGSGGSAGGSNGGSRQGRRTDSSNAGLPAAGPGTGPARQGGAGLPAGGGGSGSFSGGGTGPGVGAGGGSAAGSRAGSAGGRPPGVPQLPVQRPTSGASLGGVALSGSRQGSRQGSGRAGSAGSADGNSGLERSPPSTAQLLPPVSSRAPSGSGSGLGAAGGEGAGGLSLGATGSGAAAATPSDLGLLTSAEADLLAEALQD